MLDNVGKGSSTPDRGDISSGVLRLSSPGLARDRPRYVLPSNLRHPPRFNVALLWQEHGKLGWFLLATVGAALAALSKLPLLYIGVPLAAIVFQREGIHGLIGPRNWIGAICVLGIVGGWYWHAYQMGSQTGLSFGFISKNSLFVKTDPSANQWISNWGTLTDIEVYKGLLYNFTWRLLTPFGLCLGVVGIILPRRSRLEVSILVWVLAVLVYFLFAAPAVLWTDYYTLALLPPAALFIGKAVDYIVLWIIEGLRGKELRFKFGSLGLATLGIAGLIYATSETAASVNDMFEPREPIVQAWLTGQWVQAVVPKNEMIITVGGGQPEGLYFSHRHGLWFAGDGDQYGIPAIDKLAKKGWKYLIVFNPYWGGINIPWLRQVHAERKLIGGGPWFLAYDISQRHSTTPQHLFEPPPQWADQVSLLGYDLTPDRVVNSKLQLILYWRADRTMPTGYTSFLHVLDETGKFCSQDDHPPLKGFYAHDLWQEKEVFADPFQVDLSNCANKGELTMNVGLYTAVTIERLPLTVQVDENRIYTFRVNPEH